MSGGGRSAGFRPGSAGAVRSGFVAPDDLAAPLMSVADVTRSLKKSLQAARPVLKVGHTGQGSLHTTGDVVVDPLVVLGALAHLTRLHAEQGHRITPQVCAAQAERSYQISRHDAASP